MMKHFIHHEKISSKDIENARKELFAKYKIYADYSTSRAFAASQKYTENSDGEENAVVLVAKDDPLFSSECKCDSSVDIVAKMNKTVDIKQKAIKSVEELKTLIESIHKYF
jgi:threonine synthase